MSPMSDLEFLERTKNIYAILAANAKHCSDINFEDLNLGSIEVDRRLEEAEDRHLAVRFILHNLNLSFRHRQSYLKAFGATEQEIEEAK